MRVTQTRPGRRRSGGRSGWSRRRPPSTACSGANEPFLAALRTATGGREIETPLDPWLHDLRTTSRFTDLWPLLLVLALLLWPLDIALRRVSIGRREFAAAGAWVRALPQRRPRDRGPDGRRREPVRRARAGDLGRDARRPAPLGRTGGGESGRGWSSCRRTRSSSDRAAGRCGGALDAPARGDGTAGRRTPGRAAGTRGDTGRGDTDTLARLRDAKRRARER